MQSIAQSSATESQLVLYMVSLSASKVRRVYRLVATARYGVASSIVREHGHIIMTSARNESDKTYRDRAIVCLTVISSILVMLSL